MKSIVKNLLWKEFRELKSVTIAAAAITLAIPLCYVFRNSGEGFFAVMSEFTIYPLIASVFFGMRAAAGERTSRVGQFIAVLPVSYRVLGSVRLGAISLAAIIPLVAVLPLGLVLGP